MAAVLTTATTVTCAHSGAIVLKGDTTLTVAEQPVLLGVTDATVTCPDTSGSRCTTVNAQTGTTSSVLQIVDAETGAVSPVLVTPLLATTDPSKASVTVAQGGQDVLTAAVP